MKFLVYSAGSGLVTGAFLLLMMQGQPEPVEVSSPEAQPVHVDVRFVNLPMVTYPVEVVNAQE